MPVLLHEASARFGLVAGAAGGQLRFCGLSPCSPASGRRFPGVDFLNGFNRIVSACRVNHPLPFLQEGMGAVDAFLLLASARRIAPEQSEFRFDRSFVKVIPVPGGVGEPFFFFDCLPRQGSPFLIMALDYNEGIKSEACRLKAAVVGGGHFGKYHVEKWARHPEVDLIAVVDPDLEAGEALVGKWGGVALSGVEKLPDDLECVSIATPAGTHGELMNYFLNRGVHVLVEKPIATDLEIARKGVQLADEKNRVLQVNHQERFFLEEAGLPGVGLGAIHSIEVNRLGPPPVNLPDCSVVLDLMIHDLDWVHAFFPGERFAVEVSEKRVRDTGFPEAVTAELKTGSGARIKLRASRDHPERRRDAFIECEKGGYSIDFIKREILGDESEHRKHREDLYGKHPFDKSDFVGKSIAHFITCIIKKRKPLVDGASGLRALETALAIEAASLSLIT